MLHEFLKIGEWQIAYNGVRLADFCIVRGVDMPLRPPITLSELTIDGHPGTWLAGVQLGARDIVVRLGMINPTRERVEMLEGWITRAALLGTDKICRLDLGGGYYVNAIMTGASDLLKNGHWSTVSITFHCPDPRIYGQTYTVDLQPGVNTVNVLGGAEVAPVFAITGASDYFDLIDEETQKRVRVRGLNSLQELVVDMGAHKCTVNGNYRPADPTITSFWNLEPGERRINLASGKGTMTYTEAWL